MDAKAWQEVERVAKLCQRTWGMGFPVISVELLAQIVARGKADTDGMPRYPSDYLAKTSGDPAP